jgi:F0F1-type ATP synthase assembly protein I
MAEGDKTPSGDRPRWAGDDDLDAVGRPDLEDLREVRLPEVPSVPSSPTLPEAPTLKPNLPKLEKPSRAAEEARQMGIAYTIPAMLIAPVVVLTLVGYWLDGHFHKSPAFTLVGALLGAISGLINMIRAASKLDK